MEEGCSAYQMVTNQVRVKLGRKTVLLFHNMIRRASISIRGGESRQLVGLKDQMPAPVWQNYPGTDLEEFRNLTP